MLVSMLGAFLLMAAFSYTVQAANNPAILSLDFNRTTVTSGQNVLITVRTTPQANFVFATIDGVTTQGVIQSVDTAGNRQWVINVIPPAGQARTTNVAVSASTTNSEAGAARITIPITITGATPTPSPTPTPTPTPPTAPVGALEIVSITETQASSQGMVRLTVITGLGVNEVWVNFNRVNNQRGTGHFARATMASQGTHSRTWILEFRPATWATQLVEVGANRTYNWPGATLRNHQLTLNAPFVPSATPIIIDPVLVNGREVTPGGTTTFTVQTNTDVGAVWVGDADGREHTASIASTTATTITWEVSFIPLSSGTVTVYANLTRTSAGAAMRVENVSIIGQRVQIQDARATWLGGANDEATVTVRTNRYAQSVWVVIGTRIIPVPAQHDFAATGDRIWEVRVANAAVPMQIRVSELPDRSSIDAQVIISTFGTGTGTGTGIIGQGSIQSVTVPTWSAMVVPGSAAVIQVVTTAEIRELRITGTHGSVPWSRPIFTTNAAGMRVWEVIVPIYANATPNTVTHFTVEARDYSNIVRGIMNTQHIMVLGN